MTGAQRRRQRRQAAVRRLRAQGLSTRDIAERLGIGEGTVRRDLAAPVPEHPVAPPPDGNGRAVVHGATSEARLAPLRDQHAQELRRDYPQLDERRLALLADRLARVLVAAEWLGRQRDLVRDDETGEPWPLLDRIEKWSSRAEAVLAELEAERRAARSPAQALEDHLRQHYGGGEEAAGA